MSTLSNSNGLNNMKAKTIGIIIAVVLAILAFVYLNNAVLSWG